MIDVLKSAAIGGATFVLEVVVACSLLLALAAGNNAWDPDSHAVRQTLAFAGLAVIAGGSLFVLVKIPFALGPRFGANPWVALAAAGLLTGVAIHPLLFYVSAMNDCTLGVSAPYDVTICSDG